MTPLEAIETPQETLDVDAEDELEYDPGMNVGEWTALIVAAMVLVIVVAALLGPLKTGLTNYAKNDTTFGPILQSIVPILIGVGILLAFVGAFLGYRAYGKKGM